MHRRSVSVFRSRPFWTSAAFGVSLVLLTVAAAQKNSPAFEQNPSPSQAAFFEEKIRPILVNACSSCHGAVSPAAGLRLDTVDGIHKGGKSGAVVVPGLPDASLLIQAVRQTGALKMPQGGVLKPEEVAALEAWVRMGAPWPADAGAKDPTAGLWSLQPVKKPALPKVHNTTWAKDAIDLFVLAGLESKHITPATPADKRTLLRRVTYDLTGLPPTPEEMDAFLTDKALGAYEKVVDRLLASPHYGERWARHWLDVARYADTKGYVFVEDRNYYNAYTYRNWVIDAFNKDLPYDQFVIDQLAADRLPQVQNGEDREALAALGFLTIGRRFLNSQPDIIDDRIDVTMRGFQAFTVGCARCHDHKFDPIPTQDYYSLYAVFNSSQDGDQPISDASISGPWQQYNEKLMKLQTSFQQLALAQTKLLRKQEEDPAKAAAFSPEIKQILQSLGLDATPDGKNLEKLMAVFEPVAKDQLMQIQRQVEAMQKSVPQTPEFAMAMSDRPNPGDTVVFKHGNPGMPGDPAPRRFLLALSKPGEERPHWTKDSGRLELAESIASKDNPLTARVFVNRLWQDHFGNGIVRTASDFGRQGEKPTNPELLDFLAASFMENGWSIKKIQKLIVMSATYRQSSSFTPAAFLADPDNRLQSRFDRSRLDLEEMRDTVMDAAGQLDLGKVGGKSVDLWSQPFTLRRAVYGFIERQNLPGVFRTFDLATPDKSSAKRFKTTVPQQALFFMNSPFVVDQAENVAKRPEIAGTKDEGQRVRRLYRLLFQRLPDTAELNMGLAYLKQGANADVPGPVDPWSYGYGGVDAASAKVSFTPLSYFEGAYRVGKAYPDPKLGYIALNKEGGHPGHDPQHCVIRRWTASEDMTIQITGQIIHRQAQGDGVKARIISSRMGLLGEWAAHNSSAATNASVQVGKGDTIDFVLDPMASDAFDAFAWAPSIRSVDGKESWSADTNFGPPPGPELNRITLYVQALMMTNEFLFVD